MIVHVDTDGRQVELQDVEDLTRLSLVLVRESTRDDLERTLLPLGRPDTSTHALLSIDALRQASGRAHEESWCDRFDSMVEYARTKGWVEDTSLRVHMVVAS